MTFIAMHAACSVLGAGTATASLCANAECVMLNSREAVGLYYAVKNAGRNIGQRLLNVACIAIPRLRCQIYLLYFVLVGADMRGNELSQSARG